MFGWLKELIKSARIARAYSAYEEDERAKHLEEALRRFDTAEIERELGRRMAPSLEEAEVLFVGPIGQVANGLERVRAVLAENQEILGLLDRFYKDELDPLYTEKNEVHAELKLVRQQKDEAHIALRSAQDDVASWYSRSTGTFFGNGGKELPNHSLFGQSFGDLDGYKRDRAEAVRIIHVCAEKQAKLGDRLAALKARIAEVKAARDRMMELKKRGYRSDALRRSIRRGIERIEEQEMLLTRMNNAHCEFLKAARHRTGATTLRVEIERIDLAREQFVRQFDDVAAVDRRRADHRRLWEEASS